MYKRQNRHLFQPVVEFMYRFITFCACKTVVVCLIENQYRQYCLIVRYKIPVLRKCPSCCLYRRIFLRNVANFAVATQPMAEFSVWRGVCISCCFASLNECVVDKHLAKRNGAQCT